MSLPRPLSGRKFEKSFEKIIFQKKCKTIFRQHRERGARKLANA